MSTCREQKKVGLYIQQLDETYNNGLSFHFFSSISLAACRRGGDNAFGRRNTRASEITKEKRDDSVMCRVSWAAICVTHDNTNNGI